MHIRYLWIILQNWYSCFIWLKYSKSTKSSHQTLPETISSNKLTLWPLIWKCVTKRAIIQESKLNSAFNNATSNKVHIKNKNQSINQFFQCLHYKCIVIQCLICFKQLPLTQHQQLQVCIYTRSGGCKLFVPLGTTFTGGLSVCLIDYSWIENKAQQGQRL